MPKVSLLAVVAALVAVGCGADSPVTSPTPIPAHGTPARLELSATPGVGQQGGSATITARVQDAYGATLPGLTVTFRTTGGSLSDASASTDDTGVARSTLTADPGVVKVTASAATTAAEVSVAVQPQAGTPPLVNGPPPVTTPTPPPVNSPPPVPLPFDIAITTVGPVGHAGQATIFSVVAQDLIASASWTFGDGGTGAGVAPSHVYVTAAAYPVTVTASDTRGRTSSISTTVTVPAAPVPSYTVSLVAAPATVTTGGSTTLTATVTPVNGAPAGFALAFDCGNGTSGTTGTATGTATCTYGSMIGSPFTARVTVTGGTLTGTATTLITVADPVPVITVGCGQPTIPALTENCHVDATLNGTPMSSAAITSVDWDFGDGFTAPATPGNNSPTHVYAAAGPRTVRATNVVVAGTTAKGSGSAPITVQ